MNILVFAPHPDDEVLGCGGTIAKHVSEGDKVYVCTVTKGVEPVFSAEIVSTVRKEQKMAHEILGICENTYLDFPAANIESVPRYEFNAKIQAIIQQVKPDVIYIPHFGDMQKDHQLVAEAIMVAVRPRGEHIVKQVYAYETLSETEWNIPCVKNAFIPNVFINITEFIDLKKRAADCFASQMGAFPNPRSTEAIEALSKVRGATMGAKSAEAFELVREYR